MSQRFQPRAVAAVRPDTPDAVIVGFAVDPGLAFRPGQYLTLRAEIGGVAEQRCYSICSAPGDALVEVAIKRVPGGRFSEWAAASLAPGMTLDVAAPEGRFGRLGPARGPRRYLAVAAGSGVTPILSLARHALKSEPDCAFALLYGNRTTGSILFRSALDDLKDRYMERFSLIHVLSGEARDVPLLHGRIDGPRLQRLAAARLIEPEGADAIFLCGPGEMLTNARDALLTAGAPAHVIQTERFLAAPGAPAPNPALATAVAASGAAATVTAIIDGAARAFPMAAGETSVIEAAARAGVELPSSCRGGMCCTCRARVVAGEALMAVNYSLEPWEIEAGFVLACQSRPTGDQLVLDFDAV